MQSHINRSNIAIYISRRYRVQNQWLALVLSAVRRCVRPFTDVLTEARSLYIQSSYLTENIEQRNRLMLFKEIMTVYFDTHMKHISTMYVQNAERVVHITTTVL